MGDLLAADVALIHPLGFNPRSGSFSSGSGGSAAGGSRQRSSSGGSDGAAPPMGAAPTAAPPASAVQTDAAGGVPLESRPLEGSPPAESHTAKPVDSSAARARGGGLSSLPSGGSKRVDAACALAGAAYCAAARQRLQAAVERSDVAQFFRTCAEVLSAHGRLLDSIAAAIRSAHGGVDGDGASPPSPFHGAVGGRRS